MAIDTFVSGAYNATYNSTAVGLTEDGFRLNQSISQENIDKSDLYGDTLLDFIYRGGQAFIQYTGKAYKAGSIAPLWPWGAALGTIATTAAPIGRQASDVAKAFVLTAVANTPAATSPASLTASMAVMAPSFNWELLFDNRLRQVPTKLQLLPGLSSGTLSWYALT